MSLTSADVGSRVVVRRSLPGERGPSGGPATSDAIGVLERLDDTQVAVRREDGTLVAFARGDLVTGKPVPSRTSTLLRLSADRLEHIASDGWPPRHDEALGEWRLRAAAGFTGRANSVLACGDPGVPLPEALARVVAFYVRHGLGPRVQVVVGSPLEPELAEQGWRVSRHGDGVLVQVASVAQARRASTSRDGEGVAVSSELTAAWAAMYGRAAGVPAAVVAHVLTGPDTVALASVEDPPVAIGRGVVTGDWLGLSAVEVVPARRGRGLARRVVDALLAWGAERGARSAYLQTMPDNTAAQALYAPYGFVTHHRYRYWVP